MTRDGRARLLAALLALAPVTLAGQAGGAVEPSGDATDAAGALDRLTGPAWLAEGDGFTSLLTYEWAVPGWVATSENILFDGDGRPFRHYRGAYQRDPATGEWQFRVDGPDGERHAGTVEVRADGVWHRGRIGDGGGYRSVVSQASDTVMEYRASYAGEDVGASEVRAAEPLVYRRLSREAVREFAAEERSYMARDGGEWWSANPAAATDPAAPPRFLYRAEARGEALHIEIVVELADGRSYTAWQIVSSFDGDPGVIRMHQVGHSGALMEGRMDPLPDGTAVLRMDGNGPGGEPVTFMDRNFPDGPSTFRSVSWLLHDGAWEESMRSTWRRAAAGGEGAGP